MPPNLCGGGSGGGGGGGGGGSGCNGGGGGGGHGVGNPINPGTGNKFQMEVDYSGGGDPSLEVKRYYNSKGTFRTLRIGTNWRLNWDRSIKTNGMGDINVYRPSGQVYLFKNTGQVYVTDADIPDRLERLAQGWKYTTEENDTELYDEAGKLLSITLRSGVTQTLSYDTSDRLISVSDTFGRTLGFSYDTLNRISAITNPAGGIISYQYNSTHSLVSVIFPDTRSRSYLYEHATYPQLLTGLMDENGTRYATWGYDSSGRAISSEHAGGAERVTLVYNADGSVKVTDSQIAVSTYRFQTVLGAVKNTENARTCTGCVSATARMTYDPNGNVSSRTDWNGNKTCYAYDLTRNLETVRLEGYTGTTCPADLAAYTPPAVGSTRKITTSWNANWRLPDRVAEPLRITTYTRDAWGNALSETVQPTSDATGALGLSATSTGSPRSVGYTYNSAGQVLAMDGPRTDLNDTTTYGYDIQGNLISVTNALGHITTLSNYDAHGQAGRVMDANGLGTLLEYTPRGWLRTLTRGAEATIFEYDGVGQLLRVTQPGGAVYTYTYDAAHRLTDIQDNLNNRIHYTLDAMGNRTREEVFNATGTVVETRSRDFDALNRLWHDIGALNQTTTYQYDANGNLTHITAPATDTVPNRTTINSYDALNRLATVTHPDSGVIGYAYSGLDALTRVTDPRNLTTEYERDGLGNLNRTISTDTGTTAATFDAAGNVLSQTDAKGQVTQYQYDALNRVTRVIYPADPQLTITYQYDTGTNGIGRLSQITDASGTLGFTYSLHGRLTGATSTINGIGASTSYQYDSQGRLAALGYPSGRTLNYIYDSLGRVSQIATTANNITTTLINNVAYHPFGGVKSFTFGNGQAYTRSRDLDGRISAYTLNGQTRSIDYDPAAQIKALTNPVNPAENASYGYDLMGRLNSFALGTTVKGYSYDQTGNRTGMQVGGTQTAYTLDSGSNRLMGIQPTYGTSLTLSYDANGAMTGDGINQYHYGLQGRLTQAVTAQGTHTYEINALGLRVRKRAPNEDTVYLYDPAGRLLAERQASSSQYAKEYVYLGDTPVAVMQ